VKKLERNLSLRDPAGILQQLVCYSSEILSVLQTHVLLSIPRNEGLKVTFLKTTRIACVCVCVCVCVDEGVKDIPIYVHV
jgi:hypothetical protein